MAVTKKFQVTVVDLDRSKITAKPLATLVVGPY